MITDLQAKVSVTKTSTAAAVEIIAAITPTQQIPSKQQKQ
jgi:hypothetical protein